MNCVQIKLGQFFYLPTEYSTQKVDEKKQIFGD